jgi:hypothetical protein
LESLFYRPKELGLKITRFITTKYENEEWFVVSLESFKKATQRSGLGRVPDSFKNALKLRRLFTLAEIVGDGYSKVALSVSISSYVHKAVRWRTWHESFAQVFQQFDRGFTSKGRLACEDEVLRQLEIMSAPILSQLDIIAKFRT